MRFPEFLIRRYVRELVHKIKVCIVTNTSGDYHRIGGGGYGKERTVQFHASWGVHTPMKITLKAGFLFWVAGIMSVSARGQALLTVQPVAGNQVQQGQTITLDVFLSNLPQGMRAYQCRFQITPQAGATGTLTLADLTVPGPPLNLINTALFINAPGWPGDGTIPIRPDWVFAPPVPSSALTAIGVPNVEFTGFMFSGTVGPFAVPKYMGTIILRASSNASGNFTVTLTNPDDAGASTFLRVGAGVPIHPENQIA